jgi:hypothetical protein
MWQVEERIRDGNITFGRVNANTDAVSVTDGFKDMENLDNNYPSLIYDGPFSDHIMEKNPVMLEGEKEITEEEALRRAVKLTGADNLRKTGDESGKMPSYVFENDVFTIAVTKNGGYYSYMLAGRRVEKQVITAGRATEIAEEYLVDFLEFCKEEEINNLIFTRFAHRNSAAHSAAVAQVAQVLENYGYSLLNLEEKIEEIGLDFDKDFYNDEHLNIYGMEKTTAYICSYLADNVLGAPVKQTAENAAHWEECVDAYQVYRAYAYDRTEKGIETWPGEEPYEMSLIENWLNQS